MENNNIIDMNNESTGSLSITSAAASYLKETAGWGKFLAIVGFVCTGLMVIAGFFVGSMMASMGQENPFGSYFGVIYVALGVLYFFPALYLFKYYDKMKKALATKNTEELTAAFENEKSMFKFMGILMIILLGSYALVFVGAIVFGAMA
jgi:hypothetical protein